jgi:hypothetical protein
MGKRAKQHLRQPEKLQTQEVCEYIYKVRQFNSRNGPVKAKFAYLCTSGFRRLRNTLHVKLALRETMVPLPETVWKIVFQNTLQ